MRETDIKVLRRVLAEMAGAAVGVDMDMIALDGVNAEAATDFGKRLATAEKN